ncbi:MAG TPA: LysR family transcriptional regulator [Acidimicrobiales bacterium]|nr:LysR family transcriptional regulator [Acidimicrobiales bacterium]
MEFRRLAALVAVAEHGTFSAAADALQTVQSNVSTHVARLERELGVTLVDRAAGQLTDEGRAVVARARRIAAELDAIRSDVAAFRDEVSGTVRLGVIGTTGRWLAPRLLSSLAERQPGVTLSLHEGTSGTLEPQLVGGRLDLAVVHLPVPPHDLVAQPLFDEDLVLVVRADDPLATRSPLRLADLAEVPLLLPIPGTAFRDELDLAAWEAGVTLRPRAELDGIRLIASLTFEGNGPAVLPATAVPGFLREGWRSVPVAGLPQRRIGVAMRRRGLPSAPTRAVLELLHEVTASGAAGQPGVHPV